MGGLAAETVVEMVAKKTASTKSVRPMTGDSVSLPGVCMLNVRCGIGLAVN